MLETIILGLVQGLTEFLPVSSSGHLVIGQKFFLMESANVVLEVSLHLGTLAAVLLFFYKDIIEILKNREYCLKVALTTCITGIVGFFGASFLKAYFHNLLIVALALMVNGVYLLTSRGKTPKDSTISFQTAVLIGLVQAIAILPGISRSGITITTLLHAGVGRREAFRYSFIISLPIILAAFFYETLSLGSFEGFRLSHIGAGVIFAFLSGYAALFILRKALNNEKFYAFGFYCLALGLLLIL